MTLPLSGTNVLDLSRVLAGPLCSMMLADMGADVIKVERPGGGDETRGWGPPFDERGESAYYLSVNRNKKSIAADLDRPEDRDMVLELAAAADVVVDNFRHGSLQRRGIDPDEILAKNPRLIWCTITGFGKDSDRIGYDLVVQAESGWMAITGNPEDDPLRVGVALADIIAGKDATIAVLAALVGRSQGSLDARARRIYISLAHSATAALINVAQNSLITGNEAKRWGNQHPNLVPYQLFKTADRSVIIAVGTDAQWKACASVLGLDDLAADASLATNAGRLAARHRIVDVIARHVVRFTADEVLEKLTQANVPCGVVRSVLEALRDVETSPLTGIAPSVPGSVRFPPPKLDEHGDEIRRNGWRVFDR
ncbi:MAG TPA: CoA transferase [Gemmatimonadaceae bacterium]|nr:CoA transferase [Gemmatimonadaceae bacterium]